MAFFDGLSSPVTSRFRIPGVVLLAGGMLGSIVAAGVARELLVPHRYALVLDARPRCGAVYFSAFQDGPIVTSHDASDGKTLTYTRSFMWFDRCEWKSVETFTPAEGGYRYHYGEEVVSCPAGSTPSIADTTPLDGFVHARRLSNDGAMLTPSSERFQPAIDELSEISEE